MLIRLVSAAFGSIIGLERGENIVGCRNSNPHAGVRRLLSYHDRFPIWVCKCSNGEECRTRSVAYRGPSRLRNWLSRCRFHSSRGEIVKGLTTAASIWTVAAIGLAVGGGLYLAAGFSTIIILIILAGIKPLEEAYRSRNQSCQLKIEVESGF